MVNARGKNGHYNGTRPPDDTLASVLQEYARKNFTVKERLARLSKDLGYHIKKTTLMKLHEEFNIPSIRKPPSLANASSVVSLYVSRNLTSTNGPDTIANKIRRSTDLKIPRDTVRKIMHDHHPEGFDLRFRGKKGRDKRNGHLTGTSVFREFHCDGHEKLNAKALRLGGKVGFDIYGMRCHSSGLFLRGWVVPNARCQQTVAHCYLDVLDQYKYMPWQLTVDGGTETTEARAVHTALRLTFRPDVPVNEVPAAVAMCSTDNTPIESAWHYMRSYNGKDLKAAIMEESKIRAFQSFLPVHILLFYWVWTPVVQACVDDFIEYFNTHRVRYQAEKVLPSGARPIMVFDFPEDYGLTHDGIPVDLEVVAHLRSNLSKSRDECFRFYDSDTFDLQASDAYEQLGKPVINMHTAWDIFSAMLPYLHL